MLNDFKNYLILNVDSKRTIKNYVAVLKMFFSLHKEFNQESINSFITKLIERNITANTINAYLFALKKYALFTKTQIDFPKSRKKTACKKITLTKEEIQNEIFPYFEMMFKEPEKRKLVFMFLVLSCLRISEMCDLKKENINFETGVIDVVGKGGKRRKTYIHPDIKEALKAEVEKSPNETALNISPMYIQYMISCINKQLNYKKHITPHTLRHAGARFYRDSGIKIEKIKELLGHSSLDTTNIYLNYEDEEIQKDLNLTKFIQKDKKIDKK